jgi:hypothetical protein
MKLQTAVRLIEKRAKDFYGIDFWEFMEMLDKGFDENMTVTKAYEKIKMEQGCVWIGMNGKRWGTPAEQAEEYAVKYEGGFQRGFDFKINDIVNAVKF